MTGVEKIQAFVTKYGENILEAIKGRNVYFPVIVAQLCLESGYGTSNACIKYNNFGGIRNLSGKVPLAIGASADANKYAIYKTPTDYLKSHVAVLSVERYRSAGVFAAETAEAQLKAIAYAGYCQDPKNPETYYSYVNSIMAKVKRIYPTLGKVV